MYLGASPVELKLMILLLDMLNDMLHFLDQALSELSFVGTSCSHSMNIFSCRQVYHQQTRHMSSQDSQVSH